MLEKSIKLVIVLVFAVTGLLLVEILGPYILEFLPTGNMPAVFSGFHIAELVLGVLGVFVFALIGHVLSPLIIQQTLRFSERLAVILSNLPTSDILVVATGVIIGLILANLLGSSFSRLPFVGPYIPLLLSLVFALVGAKVALRKRAEVVAFFNRVAALRMPKEGTKKSNAHKVYCNHKILDTSVLIDGRIADIIKTGFLDGRIVIPKFVLEELQKIADSADTLKRNRGRRGLDVVKEIQANKMAEVVISDKDYDDLNEVDAKLVRLAREDGGVVATNDFNLSKVAEIQGVRILNVNDLANAVKQAVLPGEELHVFLAKEGKEAGQAIGYLDDGTMIVVENGKKSVNLTVSVLVTSVLQTSAGRMIFAKMK